MLSPMPQPPLSHTKFYKNWSWDLSFKRIFKILVPKFTKDQVIETKKTKNTFWFVKGTVTGSKSHNFGFLPFFYQFLIIFRPFNFGGFNFFMYRYTFRNYMILWKVWYQNYENPLKTKVTRSIFVKLCVREGWLGHRGKHRKWVLYALIIQIVW